MRTPGFWFTAPDALAPKARLLRPLSRLYAAATARRLRHPGTRVSVPVICVGNLNAGGTGKTPTVIALLARLRERKIHAHVVSRGHGGKLTGPLQVDPGRHVAADVGDEPLLLARHAPVWIARDRAAGAIAAIAAGAEAIILDDGFQNPALIKDLSLIVVDAERGFGNGLCLPAGPLREPVATGLGRADLLLSIGRASAQQDFVRRWGPAIVVPHLTAALEPVAKTADWAGQKVLAFAGIGHPGKFFETLHGLGAEIVEAVPFGDHRPLGAADLARLATRAASLGATLATTEKDAMRLSAEWRDKVRVLPVQLKIDDPGPLDAALTRIGC